MIKQISMIVALISIMHGGVGWSSSSSSSSGSVLQGESDGMLNGILANFKKATGDVEKDRWAEEFATHYNQIPGRSTPSFPGKESFAGHGSTGEHERMNAIRDKLEALLPESIKLNNIGGKVYVSGIFRTTYKDPTTRQEHHKDETRSITRTADVVGGAKYR